MLGYLEVVLSMPKFHLQLRLESIIKGSTTGPYRHPRSWEKCTSTDRWRKHSGIGQYGKKYNDQWNFVAFLEAKDLLPDLCIHQLGFGSRWEDQMWGLRTAERMTNPDELSVHVIEAANSHGGISWQLGKGWMKNLMWCPPLGRARRKICETAVVPLPLYSNYKNYYKQYFHPWKNQGARIIGNNFHARERQESNKEKVHWSSLWTKSKSFISRT